MSMRIGQYRTDQLLGHGSYGEVYSARFAPDPRLRVALTCLRSDVLERPGFVAALKANCVDWSERNDPTRPMFRELICRDEQVVVVRELLNGANLGVLLKTAPLGGKAIQNLMESLLSALSWLHSGNHVHGRIRPDNVFLCDDGRILWLDMALSQAANRARFDWDVVRDLRWCAPEVCRAGDGHVGPAADVYSLGLLFWSLATGREPCPVDEPRAQLHWHLLHGPEPIENLPPWIHSFIQRMTHPLPQHRPLDGHQALEEFRQAALEEHAVEVARRPHRLPAWAKRPNVANMVDDALGGTARVVLTAIFVVALVCYGMALAAALKVVDSKGTWRVPHLEQGWSTISSWWENDGDGEENE